MQKKRESAGEIIERTKRMIQSRMPKELTPELRRTHNRIKKLWAAAQKDRSGKSFDKFMKFAYKLIEG